jgi:glucose-6-phosphate dehydrogenase assembly protein OpcA
MSWSFDDHDLCRFSIIDNLGLKRPDDMHGSAGRRRRRLQDVRGRQVLYQLRQKIERTVELAWSRSTSWQHSSTAAA